MSWRSAIPSRRRRISSRVNLFYRFAVLFFVGVVGLFLASFVIFPLFALDLPSPDKIVRREGFSTKIYDRNKVLLYDIFANQKRTPVTLADIPEYLRQATIAIEDKNFYKHGGFDATGILRAAFNIIINRKLQGGSTLTQQLVKNVLLSSERTLPRKIREFILATQIERQYSKDEILQMYLNEAPYGGTSWGVEAASETYFGKSVRDLTLVESAVLAGLPQRPSYYSPYGVNPEAYKIRTEQVLRRMREDGYINSEQEGAALRQLSSTTFVGKGTSLKAPHFVIYVQSILEERYGQVLVEQGGLKVTTSLDWELQQEAQKVVAEEIAKVESLNITNGAVVAIDPTTGEILSMVGSKDFAAENYDGQVNVTLSLRQPGSAIKPVTYVTALKRGYTASSLLIDAPATFPGGADKPEYTPVNYDGKFRGPVQLRYALGNSLNIPAVKMLSKVGVKDVLTIAYDLGFSTLEPSRENLSRLGLSMTLGGGEVKLLEMTSAYSAFANDGLRFEPVAILKVEDANGRVLEEFKPPSGRLVLSSEEAYIISNILSDNNARADVFGTNSLLNVAGRSIAVKTGTTNDSRDNWTVGWTPQIIVGVWVGNNDNSEMKRVASGVSGAAPIWRKVILKALEGKANVAFEVPSGIVVAEVDSVSGYRAHDGFAARDEIFIKGTEPTQEDVVHKKLKICKSEGKLATPSQVAANDFEEKEFTILKEDDPFNKDVNRWQEGIDKWISEQSDSRFRPPTDFCGSANPLNVEFISPRDHETVKTTNGSFEISADARSTSDIVQIEVEIGSEKFLLTEKPWKVTVKNIKDGAYSLVARAKDKNGSESDRRITIGVNLPWDYAPSPTPTP